MPRLSPQQLQEARRRRQLEREEAEERARRQALQRKETAKKVEEARRRWELLNSVLIGLYEEFDKLTKKAPADQVTELGLRRVNELVKQAKDLLSGDPFIDSIDLFVPAGENPEHRDVLLVLREIRQGMKRKSDEYERFTANQRGW